MRIQKKGCAAPKYVPLKEIRIGDCFRFEDDDTLHIKGRTWFIELDSGRDYKNEGYEHHNAVAVDAAVLVDE